MLKTIFQPLIAWYLAALKTGGFPLVALLMTMESSFLPLPSELIIPPAAHLAWSDRIESFPIPSFRLAGGNRHRHRRRVRFVAGRDDRCIGWRASPDGRWCCVTEDLFCFRRKNWKRPSAGCRTTARWACFSRDCCRARGNSSAFRPASRGFDYPKFSIFTLLGATIWCSVLCYVGVKIGRTSSHEGEMRHVTLWVGGAALVLGGLYYFFVHRHIQKAT